MSSVRLSVKQSKGILIKKKREIFMYYIKSSFINDVIVLAPFVCEIMNL